MDAKLYNYYWFIRCYRDKAVIRKYYRLVAKEKKRLESLGVDKEEIRLLCRFLANTRNAQAEKRLESYRKNLLKRQLSV
ncbi:MAG: hypothetical protein IPI97_06050 [Nitrosomonas sp.]|nr:hypothetical protein [Nitrosomonas sp.]